MKKRTISLILALAMALVLAVPAFAASPTITVRSRYSDNSIKEVTYSGTYTIDNITVNLSGTTLTFPYGKLYSTPTEADCKSLLAAALGYNTYANWNGGNANYNAAAGERMIWKDGYGWIVVDANGYIKYTIGDTAIDNSTAGATTAQVQAELAIKDLRDYCESYGLTLDYRPSTSIKPTAEKAWYAVTVSKVSGKNVTPAQYSVLTEKSGTNYVTRFKVFRSGAEVASYTLAEVKDVIWNAVGSSNTYGTLPPNVFKVSTPAQAADAMVKYLRNTWSYSVTVANSTYGTESGTATVSVTKGSRAPTILSMYVEKRDASTFRVTFRENGEIFSIPALLTLY